MAGLYLAPVVCETVSSRERRGRRRRTFPETPKTSIFGLPSANQRTRRFSRTGSLVNAAQFVGATPLMDWRNHPGLLAARIRFSSRKPTVFLPSFLPALSTVRPIFCIHFITLSFRVSPLGFLRFSLFLLVFFYLFRVLPLSATRLLSLHLSPSLRRFSI